MPTPDLSRMHTNDFCRRTLFAYKNRSSTVTNRSIICRSIFSRPTKGNFNFRRPTESCVVIGWRFLDEMQTDPADENVDQFRFVRGPDDFLGSCRQKLSKRRRQKKERRRNRWIRHHLPHVLAKVKRQKSILWTEKKLSCSFLGWFLSSDSVVIGADTVLKLGCTRRKVFLPCRQICVVNPNSGAQRRHTTVEKSILWK